MYYDDIQYEKMSEYIANRFNEFLINALPSDQKSNTSQESPTFDINYIKEINMPETIKAVETDPVETLSVDNELVKQEQSSDYKFNNNDDNSIKRYPTPLTFPKVNILQNQISESTSLKPKTLIEEVAFTLDCLFSTGFDIATERNQEMNSNQKKWETISFIYKNQNNFRTDYITNEAIIKYEKKLNELFGHLTDLGEQIRNKAREKGDEKLRMISHYIDNIAISIFTEDSILKDYAFIPSEERNNAYKLQKLLSELIQEESGSL